MWVCVGVCGCVGVRVRVRVRVKINSEIIDIEVYKTVFVYLFSLLCLLLIPGSIFILKPVIDKYLTY